MAISGIYCIRNLLDGKRYIGSAQNFKARWKAHKRCLRKAAREANLGLPEKLIHGNLHLQRAWVRDGEAAFVFEILEICAISQLYEREQHYLDTEENLYNISQSAECPMRGRKRTAAHTAKIVAANTGRQLGPLSEEHRAKISAALLGSKRTEEQRAHMSEAAKAKKGKYPCSEKKRALHKAYAATEEGCKHFRRLSQLGVEALKRKGFRPSRKDVSEETRKKLSDSIRASWIKRREKNRQQGA